MQVMRYKWRFFGRLLAGGAFFALAVFMMQPQNAPAETAKPLPAAVSVHADIPDDPARRAIEDQFRAVHDRNEQAAYAFVSPHLKKKYDNAGSFFTALRFTYRPIYKHLTYTFLEGHENGDQSFQKIQVMDSGNDPHTVLVKLSRQDDGHWLIDGYTVLEAERDPL